MLRRVPSVDSCSFRLLTKERCQEYTYIRPCLIKFLYVRRDGHPTFHDGFVKQVLGQRRQNLERKHKGKPGELSQEPHVSHIPFFSPLRKPSQKGADLGAGHRSQCRYAKTSCEVWAGYLTCQALIPCEFFSQAFCCVHSSSFTSLRGYPRQVT